MKSLLGAKFDPIMVRVYDEAGAGAYTPINATADDKLWAPQLLRIIKHTQYINLFI